MEHIGVIRVIGQSMALVVGVLLLTLLGVPALATEGGEEKQKEGKASSKPTEDPALKLLLKKGVISQAEYDEAVRAAAKEQAAEAPPFKVGYKKGLFFDVGDKFSLKVRARLQFRYTHDQFNSLYDTLGDTKNFGSTTSPIRRTEDVNTLHVRRARLVFSGYAFDPRVTYSIQLAAETSETATAGGSVTLFDAFVRLTHLPYANVQFGQYKVFFNRAQIGSTAEMQFPERAIVQDAFPANGFERRDQGITLMNDPTKYWLNYAVGVFNGAGRNLTNSGFASSDELMYVGRLDANLLGNPGYDQGDASHSKSPQLAVAAGYAYNPGVDTAAFAGSLRGVGNGRLANQGLMDFGTFNGEVVFKYMGFSIQSEYYLRNQDRHSHTVTATSVGNATGFYVQSGYFVVPKTVEIAARYGWFDPDTNASEDLIREVNLGMNWMFVGHDHKVSLDYSNITSGTGSSGTGGRGDLLESRVRVQYQLFF